MSPEQLSAFTSPPSTVPLEFFLSIVVFASVFAFLLSPGGLAWALSKSRTARTAIPGPNGVPLLGLVFAFTGSLTHRVLAELARNFRAVSLMAFSVGFTRFVISSDPDTAKEILGSSAFADRPVKESAYGLLFHRAMGFAPYGEYWRNLRRISATHLFSPRRIAQFGRFRSEIGREMVEQIGESMRLNGRVDVKRVLHFGALNNVMMTVFGRRYQFCGGRNGGGGELEGMVSEGYELLGVFNWSDHFPFLGWFDLQGVRKRCRVLAGRVNVFVGKIIEEHRASRASEAGDGGNGGGGEGSGDFVDVLLGLEDENKLTDSDMVAVLWEMIFRGTDTVAILLEWILAKMVIHQDIQAKAQAEMDSVVGKIRSVSNSDLPNLPYLQAIIKETLRMHPPGPLLSWARLAIYDTHVGHHFIPAGTTAMVNMWAITHDERVWPEPNVFNPERFMEEDVPIMGSDLRLSPFGSGRRVCPGKAMGLAMVQLWLAQLLQSFKWEEEEDGVDLSEVLKLSMEMKNPLSCKVIPRV